MELQMCPCCDANSLMLTVKMRPGGMEVIGQCTVCGYACDSDYLSAELPDDLRAEYEYSVIDGSGLSN